MRRLLVPLAGVCVLAGVAGATAQETKSIQGSVRTVTADSITVNVGEKPMTFKVDSRTDVTARGASTATRTARAEGKPGAVLTDLVKPGQAVEVRFHQDMHAASIRVLPGAPSRPSPENERRTADGVVTAVTPTSLTIKAAAGELTFTIDEKTQVTARGASTATREKTAAGQKTAINDFVGAGDTVSVRYRQESGRNIAAEVRVTRKGAAS